MDALSHCLSLTPHGRLFVSHDADAARLDDGLADRLRQAFERGSGHGLLLLGADEAGTALPPVHSYWREFGARYVTALCTRQDSDAPVEAPDELERMAFAAPPMMGAEYLTVEVLGSLWAELNAAFGIELAESKSSVQEFLQRFDLSHPLVQAYRALYCALFARGAFGGTCGLALVLGEIDEASSHGAGRAEARPGSKTQTQ